MTLQNCILNFFLLLLIASNNLYANNIDQSKGKHIILIAPPIINSNYYLIEYGFQLNKNVNNYDYSAFVKGALFEDWQNRQDNLKAGALGFKAGISLPLNPDYPIALQLDAGYSKAVLHQSPIFGKKDQTVEKNNLFLIEIGLNYQYSQYLFNIIYQKNNVQYFSRKTFFSIGVNY